MTTTPIPARTDNRRLNMANGFALSSALYTVTRVGVADLLQGQKNGKLLVVDPWSRRTRGLISANCWIWKCC